MNRFVDWVFGVYESFTIGTILKRTTGTLPLNPPPSILGDYGVPETPYPEYRPVEGSVGV